MMKTLTSRAARIAYFAAMSALLAACATYTETTGPRATATLEPRSGSGAGGTVNFTGNGQKVRVDANVTGLTPGVHGFHVHEVGDCSAPDASSAKGHFNPGGMAHGHHAGDMANLNADIYGNAILSTELDNVTVGEGPTGLLGRSVVVHADPDDYTSQPAGNSGKRVACGVIRPR